MIQTLAIHHVRALVSCQLSLAACNVFIGDNGSGKTSLLESLFLLSRGRSFRHHQPKHYIHHHHDSCTVWASLSPIAPTAVSVDDTLAIQKQRDATTLLRMNGMPVPAQSSLTMRLPTLIIDPAGMDVLEDGSGSRRQLIDWLAFHVDGKFYPAWLDYNRLLKQRNALLKMPRQAHDSIRVWDQQLSDAAMRLHSSRQAVFERWQDDFYDSVATLLPDYAGQLSISYQAGFDTKRPLSDILAERVAADIELGYTRIGAHRADLLLGYKYQLPHGERRHEQAINVLSRGEKKLLITALRLSQLPLVCAHAAGRYAAPVVLIDDIDAELGARAMRALLSRLLTLPCQLFITSLNDSVLAELPADSHAKCFRVADGQITAL